MKKTVIGVSGINATDNPGPGCGVARSLVESMSNVSVIGLSYDANDPGNYMADIFSNSFLMPYPSKGWENIEASLDEIQKKTNLNILIPCLDVELPLMIKYQDRLAEMGLKTLLPTKEQFDLRGKDNLPDLVKKIGCLHPETKTAYSIEEMIKILKDEIKLPAVIKGKYYQAYVVYNLETAILKATEIAAQWGFPLLVQEKIEGQEVNMIGLSNFEGQVKGRVSIKKQLTTHLGKIWTGVTIRDERLDKICDNFAQETKWRGPFELEFMTNKDGVYLIEINPRFPSWVYFATAVGINLPQMLAQIIESGDCEQKFDYQVGKYLVRYSAEFVTDLKQFQNLISHKNRDGL